MFTYHSTVCSLELWHSIAQLVLCPGFTRWKSRYQLECAQLRGSEDETPSELILVVDLIQIFMVVRLWFPFLDSKLRLSLSFQRLHTFLVHVQSWKQQVKSFTFFSSKLSICLMPPLFESGKAFGF